MALENDQKLLEIAEGEEHSTSMVEDSDTDEEEEEEDLEMSQEDRFNKDRHRNQTAENEQITKVKEEPLDVEIDFVKVKEEPLDYLAGYSLANVELPTNNPWNEIDRNGEKESARGRPSKVKFLNTYSKFKGSERASSIQSTFPCNQRDEKLKSKRNLSTHKSIHGGMKAMKCLECKLTFCRRQSLELHLKSHAPMLPTVQHNPTELIQQEIIPVKLFQCNERGCNKTFMTAKDLNHHKKSHSLARHLRTKQTRINHY